MAEMRFTPEEVPELAHPLGHDHLCSAQITTALDALVRVAAAHEAHAWDFETNVTAIVVDPETRTIRFEIKDDAR